MQQHADTSKKHKNPQACGGMSPHFSQGASARIENNFRTGQTSSKPGNTVHGGSDAVVDPHKTLSSRFGLPSFRPGQLSVIESLLKGRSAVAVFPTGGGKSLCYQLPAVELDGLTIVVSPLMALMREQVDQLVRRGIAAARWDSSLSWDESRKLSQSLRGNRIQLLYVAPERFFNERFRELIACMKIALFAVDEAHCISQWGHHFRPDYLKLARIAKQLQVQRVLALTATATPPVVDDICREFGIDRKAVIQTPFYRPNLSLCTTLCTEQSREALLVEQLQGNDRLPAIVYVTLQKTAEQVAQLLQKSGVPAKAYHAGLKDQDRSQVQDWFMRSQRAVVVATIAFGMGIDKSDIRSILHFNPSKSLENYAQEIGRAGRDNRPAVCQTLLVPEDRVTLENFSYGDTPSRDSVRKLVEILAKQPDEFFISHYGLAYETDIRETVLRTILTYLELKGLISATAPRYDTYRFQPRMESKELLARFDDSRRRFVASVLALSVKRKTWIQINIAKTAEKLKSERSRIAKMFDYLAQQKWIDLEVAGIVHGYRKQTELGDCNALTGELHEYLLDREAGEINRLNLLFSFFASERCQHAVLSEHFGQPMTQTCGHCGVCQENSVGRIPEPSHPPISKSAWTALNQLVKSFPDLLSDCRQQARFMCGLSTPALIRSRLTRDSSYGCCSDIPFQVVLEELKIKNV